MTHIFSFDSSAIGGIGSTFAPLLDMATRFLHAVAVFSALYEGTTSTSIAEIQGNAYQSPLAGQKVSGVTGLVTAKVRVARDGFR